MTLKDDRATRSSEHRPSASLPQATRQYYGSEPGSRYVTQAAALLDEAEGLLRVGLPGELRQRLWRVAAAGGPAPPPPGGVTGEQLAARATREAEAAAREGQQQQQQQQPGGRASSRLRGQSLPDAVSRRCVSCPVSVSHSYFCEIF